VSSRAKTIFDQAMSKGHHRWGRKAKLTAGASVAVALRESHKSESLRDIAVSIL
jgi:transcription factor IIIB 90 kDa subunit